MRLRRTRMPVAPLLMLGSVAALTLAASCVAADAPPAVLSSTGWMNNTGCDSAVTNCTVSPVEQPDVFYFDQTQRNVLWSTTIVGTCLSILGTSLITFSYLAYPSLRTFPYKLIVLMSLSDLLGSISYLIPTGDLDPQESATGQLLVPIVTTACVVQASMSQFFSVAAFLWTAVFSFNIYEVLVAKRSNVEEFERYYHLVCWGLPAILLSINLALGSFGPTLVWCWITSEHNVLRAATFYGPLILIFLMNLVFYLLIGRSLKSMGEDKQIAITGRLRQYLLVFFAVRVWSLINRFQNVVEPTHPLFALYFMHSACSPLQGFANSVVYGLNVRVRSHYAQMCCRSSSGTPDLGSSPENSLPEHSTDSPVTMYSSNGIASSPAGHSQRHFGSPSGRYQSMEDSQ